MRSYVHRETGRRTSWLHVACGSFIVLWLDVGVGSFLATSVPAMMKVAVLGLWLCLAVGRSRPFLGTLAISGWPLIVMLLISVLFSAEVVQSVQYTQGFAYLGIAFAFLCFYSQSSFRRERNLLVGVMATDLAITGVKTLVALQSDPQLSRYLATTEENRIAIYGARSFAGFGGYGYAYSLAAVVLVLLYFAAKSRRGRLPLTFLVAAALVIIFEMAFTTAIVLVVALAAAFLVSDLVDRRFRVVIYAAILVGWITGLYSAALDGLSGQRWVATNVSERLRELSNFMSGEVTSGGDLETRFDHWSDSIDVLLASGPLGLAGQGTFSQAPGGHSQWLDLLASYGLFALLVALYLIFAWRLCVSQLMATAIEPLRRSWIFFLVLGFVNTLLFSTIVLTWMFFVPSLVSWLEAKTSSPSSETSERTSV